VTSQRDRATSRDRQARWRKRQLLPGKVVVLRNQEVDIDALGRAFVNAEWLAAHGLTNNRKRLLSDRRVRGDVIGGVEEALVDLRARHEAVDLDVWVLAISMASSSSSETTRYSPLPTS
jgi:hypothetical protein